MYRSDLMDKLEEIQNKNYNRFKGVNEADLATREDIADLFEKLLSEAREGKKPINDAPAGGLSKHDVIKSVCPRCGETENFRTDGKKMQCASCGRWWRQTVL